MKRLKNLDWNKWFRNTLLFFSPVVILYLAFVEANIRLDGFQLTDFYPTTLVIGSMILYVLNVLLDFFKKFISANPE
jgi:hypothetical protein